MPIPSVGSPNAPAAGSTPKLLSALLDATSFRQAAEAIAAPFRSRFGLPTLRQVGCVTADIAGAVASLEERGVGPFLSFRGATRSWIEHGVPGHFSGEMALGVYQDTEIELLAPGTGSDFYREKLDPEGGIALHHLGFAADDLGSWTASMATAGYTPRVEGSLGLGPMTTQFAYFDTAADMGIIVEVICFSLGGRPANRSVASLARLIARMQRRSRAPS